MDWPTIVLGVGGSLGTAALGYWVGRAQEVDRQRLVRAFPVAEEIAVLAQGVHSARTTVITWFNENFSHISTRGEAVRLFEKHGSLYESERQRIVELLKLERELGSKLHVGRVYLNARDMDRLEQYVQLGAFHFTDDGMGGALYTDYWERFFDNLLEPETRARRDRLWLRIRRRFPKMHTLWQLRRGA